VIEFLAKTNGEERLPLAIRFLMKMLGYARRKQPIFLLSLLGVMERLN
jgi:hypothetical protein